MTPAEFAAAMPKVSLHCHLTGAVAAATVVELAARHGVPVPGDRTAETLYDVDAHADLAEFLRVYDTVGAVVREPADFERVTYETLVLAAGHGVLHREMFVSPGSHAGVPWPVQLAGITAGLEAAERDAGITCRLIVAINREGSPAAAVELVEQVIEHRTDHVVGIGLDYAEVSGPPEKFVEAFARARRAGLRRTGHSESGPPSNITTMLDALGCERIDHGYHVVTDAGVTARCRDDGIPFTCTPISSDVGRYSGSGDGTHAVIGAMVDAGLAVTIDSDDPPMFGTDPTNDFQVLAAARGYGPDQLIRFTHTAVEASWLDDTEKAALRARVTALTPEF